LAVALDLSYFADYGMNNCDLNRTRVILALGLLSLAGELLPSPPVGPDSPVNQANEQFDSAWAAYLKGANVLD